VSARKLSARSFKTHAHDCQISERIRKISARICEITVCDCELLPRNYEVVTRSCKVSLHKGKLSAHTCKTPVRTVQLQISEQNRHFGVRRPVGALVIGDLSRRLALVPFHHRLRQAAAYIKRCQVTALQKIRDKLPSVLTVSVKLRVARPAGSQFRHLYLH
jgi:hypothetical protein